MTNKVCCSSSHTVCSSGSRPWGGTLPASTAIESKTSLMETKVGGWDWNQCRVRGQWWCGPAWEPEELCKVAPMSAGCSTPSQDAMCSQVYVLSCRACLKETWSQWCPARRWRTSWCCWRTTYLWSQMQWLATSTGMALALRLPTHS